MRHWINALLIASLSLGAACTASPTAVKKTGAKSTVKSTPKPRPTASATAKPGQLTAQPSPTPVDLGPTSPFTGKITIDAHYLLSNNAGSLISNNSGSAIALKGGSLISDNGLGLISDNGLGLISDNGLGLISDNGLGLISNNAGSYRIAAADDVPLGTILPVKGMAVFPISLRTGALVGKAVLTDENGSYTLAVPDSVKGNLRIVARIPVQTKDDPIAKDPRVQYNLVVKAEAPTVEAPTVVDEDTSVTARYLRKCFAGRLVDIMLSTDGDAAATELAKGLGFDESIKTYVQGVVVDINDAAKAAKVPSADKAKVEELAQRLADILLSYVDIDAAQADPMKWGEGGPKVPAMPLMVQTVKVMRDAATVKMKDDPEYFNTQELVTSAKWERTIKKPSDMCDFVVDNYLLSLNGNKERTTSAFEFLGVTDPELQADKLNGAAIGILAKLGQTMLANSEAKVKVLDAIKAAKL